MVAFQSPDQNQPVPPQGKKKKKKKRVKGHHSSCDSQKHFLRTNRFISNIFFCDLKLLVLEEKKQKRQLVLVLVW